MSSSKQKRAQTFLTGDPATGMRSSQGVGGNEAVIWLLANAGPEVLDWRCAATSGLGLGSLLGWDWRCSSKQERAKTL